MAEAYVPPPNYAQPKSGPWQKPRPVSVPCVPDNDPRMVMTYLRENPDFFLRNCLKIQTKRDGLQPLVLNTTQKVLIETIARERAAGRRPQIIVLKSRQVGVSTVSEALGFAETFLNPHRNALVVAHETDAAKGLLRMTHRYNRNLPAHLRVKENKSNVKEIEFPHDSRMQVEAEGEVRSMTAQFVHGSEVAFWKTPEITLTAMMQTMPNDPSCTAILESTANGQGNLFHSMFVTAMTLQGDPDVPVWEKGWVPVFIPWYKHDEYVMKPWFRAPQLTDEERALARRFGLRGAQLAWRRWCIKYNCHGDVDKFRVEYPSTWQEAFALSGRPIFPAKELEHYDAMQPPQNTKDSLWVVSRPSEIEWDAVASRPQVVETPGGRLRIFRDYNPRHTYIVGADPSEGDPKSDPSPLEVFDQMTFEFVAEWWGRTPPDLLAKYAAWLGWYYGTALIIGEANNHGILFNATLLDLGYGNIWFRTTHEESVAGEVTEKPGLMQTNKTKHALIDTFRRLVREQRGGIYSPILLGEMKTAIYDRKEGREVTQITKPSGCHIDTVMSSGLCLLAHRGAIENPLVPLPERDLLTAAGHAALLREKDPEAADRYALDMTGMTAADLDAVYEARHQSRLRTELTGLGRGR